MNRRALGTKYEELAAACLQKRGYRILERNFRCRAGEIDLIARDQEYLVFVEVKYRANADCGSPLEAVDVRKQGKLLKAARYYLMLHGYAEETDCRFDVVAIRGDAFTLVQNAFGE
ncbi:MAG: YraN family protein [Muribaculaceae bacterium]|nr:YraN family protein [Roseburia sp.]MCM1431262.1 YraN family protein [Muribaculaceae bacterium]MCM1492252.1 YraN family protein [Muribaculaceae bacterium]